MMLKDKEIVLIHDLAQDSGNANEIIDICLNKLFAGNKTLEIDTAKEIVFRAINIAQRVLNLKHIKKNTG